MNAGDYVKANTDRVDLLCQLAEEAAELSQAALKVARKLKGTNPTPKSLIECKMNLIEEVADVELCLNLLGMFNPLAERRELDIMNAKVERWAARIRRAK